MASRPAIVILTASTGRAWSALAALGVCSMDARLTVVHAAHQLDGWPKDAPAVCVDDAPERLPADLRTAAAGLRLAAFATLRALAR
ncbi:MAG: hypothetical protein NW200_12470 [Hyphomonadaceae bacterium]|nr:hypothetical protein [Hyphomonadaceae bacterium]